MLKKIYLQVVVVGYR